MKLNRIALRRLIIEEINNDMMNESAAKGKDTIKKLQSFAKKYELEKLKNIGVPLLKKIPIFQGLNSEQLEAIFKILKNEKIQQSLYDGLKEILPDAIIDLLPNPTPGKGKKRISGGFSLSDLRKLLNQMHEKKNSGIKIKESGNWDSKLENSYQEAVGLYASEHKGKKWKEVSKKVGQKATLAGMYKWLSSLYQAASLQSGGRSYIQGGDSNIEKITSILSGNAHNKNNDATLKNQAQKFIDAGAKGDAKKIKTLIDLFVLGNGAGLNDNPKMQKSIIKGLLKIYAPGEEPAAFLKGTKAERLYSINESLGLSRGTLYRKRYRRY